MHKKPHVSGLHPGQSFKVGTRYIIRYGKNGDHHKKWKLGIAEIIALTVPDDENKHKRYVTLNIMTHGSKGMIVQECGGYDAYYVKSSKRFLVVQYVEPVTAAMKKEIKRWASLLESGQ